MADGFRADNDQRGYTHLPSDFAHLLDLQADHEAPRAAARAVDDWFAGRLDPTTRPLWEVDGRLYLGPSQPRITVLVASTGTIAVRAMLRRDMLVLISVDPADATHLVQAVVSVLPACQPGGGMPISLPAEQLDRAVEHAGSNPYVLRDRLVARGVNRDDARRLALVLSTRRRVGTFGMTHMPARGKRLRAKHAVTFFDAQDGQHVGRYLFTRKPEANGWRIVLAGTDTARLVSEISQLRHQLPDG